MNAKTQISVSLSQEIYDRLNAYCERTGVKKNFVVDKAISEYLDILEGKEPDVKEDVQLTQRDIFKLKKIIKYYESLDDLMNITVPVKSQKTIKL